VGESDTIAALATAPGSAGVAIVRLSGPLALPIACRLTGREPSALPHGLLKFGALRDADGQLIDRGYVVVLRAPHTFTGEDVAELQVHGSPAGVARLLEVVAQLGARPALPGEFTLRAFEHGRLDLVQAEALADLVSAHSESARQAALQHLDGAFSQALAALRTPILHALAEVEARLDFATEADVGLLDRQDLAHKLAELQTHVASLLGTARAGRLRLQGARAVLYGAPNAGKSTLLNALCGVDRALVDDRPGTTRDTIEVTTTPEGIRLTWIDTAGVRETDDPVERQGTARARAEAAQADVVLWIQDGHAPPSDPPPPAGQAVILTVRTKADLPLHPDHGRHDHAVSVHAGLGIDALRQAVVQAVRDLGELPRGQQVAIARERHAEGLRQALDALERARLALAQDEPLELPAADLRDAALALDELTGSVTPDDVLGAIFSQFCIGK
jgi:tRNA modification GTPase